MESRSHELSQRYIHNSHDSYLNYVESLWSHVSENHYNENNIQGFINMASAENCLMSDVINNKINEQPIKLDMQDQNYFPHVGSSRFRNILAEFLQKNFSHGKRLIDPEMVVGISGVNSAIEALVMCIADPGDSIMTLEPYYEGIRHYVCARTGARLIGISQPEPGVSLSKSHLKSTYASSIESGAVIRGLLLVNPSNPGGHAYTKDEILVIMEFCYETGLHMISDEVFAFSVHKTEERFTSVLSQNLMDSRKTHVVYSLSKDFGLAGLRAGVIYTENRDVIRYLNRVPCSFNNIPPLIQQQVSRLLQDQDWLYNKFLPEHYKRLQLSYAICRDACLAMGATVRESSSGLFVLADFSDFLNESTLEAEDQLLKKFLKAGVILLPGQLMNIHKPGLFRVIFARPTAQLKEGLRRIEKVLSEQKNLT